MRQLLLTVLVMLSFATAVPAVAFAVEQIELFQSDITVQPEGIINVTETIQYDFGDAERRGIFRTISLQHAQPATSWYKERVIEVSDIEVLQDGQPAQVQVSEGAGELEIRIGDPNQTITGLHEYVISYDVAGALSYYDDGTLELYWNVTGNDWNVPINQALARVTNSNLLETERTCYVGAFGATDTCEVSISSSTVTFSSAVLAPGSGLTIAQALSSLAVDMQIIEEILWFIFVIPFMAGAVGYLGYRTYRSYTTHDPNLPVIAQYEPYQDFKPMYSGVLVDDRLDPKDITAGIIYLAEQGFLKIRRTEKKVFFLFEVDDYQLELVQNPTAIESAFLRDLLSLLFAEPVTGAMITLSQLKNNYSKQRENQKLIQKLQRDLRSDLKQNGFTETWFGLLHRSTRKGYEAKNHLAGFKEFLSVTDRDRFAFHNAPKKDPETFMKYLPYAVALGVEEEWAKVFSDVTIPQPGWYDGGAGAHTFSAAALTRDLGAFSTAFASSSGSSASSGGGSSGGGSGGGGGGSW